MKKKAKKVSRGVSPRSKAFNQAKSEAKTIRSALWSAKSVIQSSWRQIVGILPRAIRLSVELLKSDLVADRAKFIIVGALCVAGFVIVKSFLSFWAITGVIAAVFGPVSALVSMFLTGTIKVFLLVVCVFVILRVFIDLVENEDLESLSKEVFGEKTSKEFLSEVRGLAAKLGDVLGAFTGKLFSIFEKVGKKKVDTFNPDEDGDKIISAVINNEKELLLLEVDEGDLDIEELQDASIPSDRSDRS